MSRNLSSDELFRTPDFCVYVNPMFLLINSMQGNMNVSDVVVRILAIDNFYKKNSFGFDLYNEMQSTRVGLNNRVPKSKADNKNRFIELIKSFKKVGYKEEYPIQVNKNFELLDGSHRLALSVYHKLPQIPVYICKNKKDEEVDYSIDWFKKNSLNHMVEHIENKYLQLVNDCRVKYLCAIASNLSRVDIEKLLKQSFDNYKIVSFEKITKNRSKSLLSLELNLSFKDEHTKYTAGVRKSPNKKLDEFSNLLSKLSSKLIIHNRITNE